MSYPWPQCEKALAPGIYFGLAAKRYHRDSALSRSGIASLVLDTPREFWESSWMNPDCIKHNESDAMKWGEKFHCLFLEKPLFEKRYRITPGPYEETKEPIKADEYEMMKSAIKVLRGLETASELFEGGYPEVTIVVPDPETGLLLRVRIDYLKTFVASDLKTARSLRAMDLKSQFRNHCYNLQEAMYVEALRLIKQMLRQGRAKVYGKDVDPAWVKKFVADDDCMFAFVLQKKQHPYAVRVIHPLSEDDVQRGREMMRMGIESYIYHLGKYGKKPWPVSEGKYEEFSMSFGFAGREAVL